MAWGLDLLGRNGGGSRLLAIVSVFDLQLAKELADFEGTEAWVSFVA